MDKTENLVGNYSHSVNLVERKNMIITERGKNNVIRKIW